MKNYLLLVSIFFTSCDNSISKDDITNEPHENVLSNKEELIKLYEESVVLLFEDFTNLNIPTDIHIDEEDMSVNAGAAFGYLEISRGLVNLKKEDIQIFVLAHEVSHIATIAQARIFNLQGDIPKGEITNDYKKAEYLADLIAVHLILKKQPKVFEQIQSDFIYLQNLLGFSKFTHPSGPDRIESLKTYIKASINANIENAFKNQFIKIWKMT